MSHLRRAALLLVIALVALPPMTAQAANYVPIRGAGSTWAQNAMDQWRRNEVQTGMTVNYQGTGSSDGRNQFRNGTVDFAVTDLPYGLKTGGVYDPQPTRPMALMPLVGGGIGLEFNLQIGGRQLTNLRLSGATITGIFTNAITSWADPRITRDNNGYQLPDIRITPVVRSDESATSYAMTQMMAESYSSAWNAYCAHAGIATCAEPSAIYPVDPSSTQMVAMRGSLGVAGYVAQPSNNGAIGYVESSYALNTGMPEAQVLNAAGYYVGPTTTNTAIALRTFRFDKDPARSRTGSPTSARCGRTRTHALIPCPTTRPW